MVYIAEGVITADTATSFATGNVLIYDASDTLINTFALSSSSSIQQIFVNTAIGGLPHCSVRVCPHRSRCGSRHTPRGSRGMGQRLQRCGAEALYRWERFPVTAIAAGDAVFFLGILQRVYDDLLFSETVVSSL